MTFFRCALLIVVNGVRKISCWCVSFMAMLFLCFNLQFVKLINKGLHKIQRKLFRSMVLIGMGRNRIEEEEL